MNKKQWIDQCASSNQNTLAARNLHIDERLFHYFLVHELVPKASNYSQISEFELQILYALKNNITLNWAYIVKVNMFMYKWKDTRLPYAREITILLETYNVNLHGEVKVKMNESQNLINMGILSKMRVF